MIEVKYNQYVLKFMNLPQAVIASITATLMVGCSQQLPSNQSPTPSSPVTATANQTITSSGTFQQVKEPIQGKFHLVSVGGKRYIELDAGFKTAQGPDLFVLLHRSNSPQSYAKQDYINLGKLQSTAGKQRYELPSNVKLSDFGSVVIWCRLFNVTFGVAPIKS